MSAHVTDLDSEHSLDPLLGRSGSGGPGKAPLTARLSSPAITNINIFRVADPGAADELAAAIANATPPSRVQRAVTASPFESCLDTDLLGTAVYAQRDGNGVAANAEASVAAASASSGAPLPVDVRDRFETSLGADLSSVRVHTGASSATAAAAVGAKAYTVGSDVHFAAGQYQPDSASGLHLLAHEVAHTQQQAGGTPRRQNKLEVSTPGDACEREADRAADAMVAGTAAAIGATSATHLARQARGDDTDRVSAMIADAPDIETVRDLKYAIADAVLLDDGTRTIEYNDVYYTVSVLGAERLLEEVTERESKLAACTPADGGMSLDARVEAAIKAKDHVKMLDLAALLDETIQFYTCNPQPVWLVQFECEELRTDEASVLAARAKLEKHIPKSIDAMTPAGVEVKNLNVGFRLAANKEIAPGLGTGGDGSLVWIGLTRSELGMRFSPPLKTYVRPVEGATVKVPTADVKSLRLIFLTGAIAVDADGMTADTVEHEIRTSLYEKLAGTGFEEAGYDPYADQWLQQRFELLETSLASGGSGTQYDDQMTAKDVSGCWAGMQLKLLDGLSQLDDKKTGLEIDKGSSFIVRFSSGGTVAKGDLVKMGQVTIETTGATLHHEGAPVVKLKKMHIGSGGKVTLPPDGFELLGKAKEAGSWESFLRIIAGAAVLSGNGVPDDKALDAAARVAEPTLVRGLAKKDVEEGLTAAVQKLILDNGDLELDGKKLKDVMGM